MALQKLFAELAERTNQVIFAYYPASRQLGYLNPAFDQVWPYAPEEVRVHPDVLLEKVHPDDRPYLEETFRLVLHGEPARSVEFRVKSPDGADRWICVSPFLLREADGQACVAGFADDITGAKHNSDILKKYAAKKNSVLEILSHDLAGPLGTIQGLSAAVGRRVKQYNDPQLEEMIDLISRMAKRNIHLIREFVKQEFLESSSVELIRQRVDILKIMGELIRQYKTAELNIAKVFRLEASADKIYIEIDEVKFMQAINNLISNAIKFTPEGGVITVRASEESDHILISVADNGIGIPENLQEGLFDKFTKARRPGLRGEESVGLGMSIIKTIVEWHQGEIRFESRENQGTTFYIRLPKGVGRGKV
jgi:two-component system sensor histidine kinase VicK